MKESDEVKVKLVRDYAEAADYVVSDYWVHPVQIDDYEERERFHRDWRVTEFHTNGLLHYDECKGWWWLID